MSSNKYTQVPLITSKQKGSKIQYSVQKQGVIFLRRLRNKKFRIVFNIIPLRKIGECSEMQVATQFNQNLIKTTDHTTPQCFIQSNQAIKQQQSALTPNLSHLTISTNSKSISDNRCIVIFNAYLTQKSPPTLVIFGYLISSLILYHNFRNEFSQQSHLTQLFCQFGQLLHKTNIDILNENIKFKSGYNKTPYFLCLLGKRDSLSDKEYQNYLNEFYRFQSQKQHSSINSALETIIDYFPQRSSLGLEIANAKQDMGIFTKDGTDQIRELGKQFESTILGRQLFNFQFTGTTIQNLAFEMCEAFNSSPQINLIEIYQKVIMNKKACLETEYVQFYLTQVQKEVFLGKRIDLEDVVLQGNLNEVRSILPVSESQLIRVLRSMRETTLKEASLQAMNCMNLEEHLQCQQKITTKISQYQKQLLNLNHQSGTQFVNQCYSILDIEQQEITFLDNEQGQRQIVHHTKVNEITTLLYSKLEAFSNQCMGLFAEQDTNAARYNDTFVRLIRQYFQKLSTKLTQTFEYFQITKRKDTLEVETLKYQQKITQQQKKRLEQQYELQLMMEAELKQKVQSFVLGNSNIDTQSIKLKKTESSHFIQSRQVYRLKKQVQQLEQQVKDKNNLIEEYQEIVEKFQLPGMKILSGDKRIDKFNQATQQLITEANEKIVKFYEILEEVKNVEKQYENAKKLLLKERQKIIAEKKENLKEIQQIKQRFDKLRLENQKLHEIIMEEKKALQNFKNLKETLKQSIDHLQAANAELKCTLAEQQGELQLYKKGLSLVVQHYIKGKSENLQKFYKFLQHQDIKDMIKPILGKK